MRLQGKVATITGVGGGRAELLPHHFGENHIMESPEGNKIVLGRLFESIPTIEEFLE